MDPDAHRLDREAMLADRLAVAERVRRETDEIVAAAAVKRRVFDEWQFLRQRSIGAAEKERLRVLAGTDTEVVPGMTDERLRAALQRSRVMRREYVVAEPAPLPSAATG